MADAQVMSSYRRGLRHGAPFVVVVVPFAMLFGVLATEAGLTIFETLSFSVVVIAGAAQFTALQLLTENAPTVVVLASALAVNLRVAMYSAALTPYLGGLSLWRRMVVAYFLVDQTYALAHSDYDTRPDQSPLAKFGYFMGVATAICPLWYVATWAGAAFGEVLPETLGIDFALPIAFLAMVAPGLRTPAHVAAAIAGTLGALAFVWLPYNLGLIVGGIAGMMVGAEIERRAEAAQ